MVRDGWVTLEGSVEWNYQRERAEQVVRRIRGVKGITNPIELQPRVPPVEASPASVGDLVACDGGVN